MGISKLNPSAGGIPFGNTAGRPTAATGKLYSNGETARLELYTSAGAWENIVQEVPGVSGISGTYNESTGSATITITGTNFVSGAIASATGTNSVEVQASSTTYNSLVQLTSVFTGLSNANEPYDIKVTNPSNLFGILPDALYINASPVWVTSSGSLGTFNEQVSITLSALSATDSDSTVSYALASGSTLPSGVTLNSSTGVISGTLPDIASNTTYTFTVNASDGANAIPRAFSFISNSLPSASGGILTSDSTYYYRAFTSSGNLVVSNGSITADILMVGGGGAGGPGYGDNDTGKGGGGAGGILYKSGHTLTSNTYSITVGNGGAGRTRGTNTPVPVGNSGQPTIAFSVQANGGGAGGGSDNDAAIPQQGGSGGGAGARNSNSNGTGASSNKTSYTGWTSYGNSGANSQNGNFGGGGGGGAGAAGSEASGSANDSTGGNGGAGVNFSSTFGTTYGASGWFGGGGGGGSYAQNSLKPQSLGGQGGGGNGVSAREHSLGGQWLDVGINGVANTGGGGGGSSEDAGLRENAGSQSGSGGSGIVIIRYLKSEAVT